MTRSSGLSSSRVRSFSLTPPPHPLSRLLDGRGNVPHSRRADDEPPSLPPVAPCFPSPLPRSLGIRGRWRDESLDWPLCPDYDDGSATTTITTTPAATIATASAPLTSPSSLPDDQQQQQQQPLLPSQQLMLPFAHRPLPRKPPLVDVVMELVGLPPWLYTAILPDWILNYTPGAAAGSPSPSPSPTAAAGGGGVREKTEGTAVAAAAAAAAAVEKEDGQDGPPWKGRFPEAVERDGSTPGCPFAWANESHPSVPPAARRPLPPSPLQGLTLPPPPFPQTSPSIPPQTKNIITPETSASTANTSGPR